MTRDEIQEKALEILKPVKKGGLAISMGVGKTRIGLRDLDENCPALTRALVVAPKKSIWTSWEDEAKEIGKDSLLDNIEFTTYISLAKKNPNDYDVVYLDECHSLLDSHRAFLAVFNGRVIGLTGTWPRYASSEKGKMCNEFCPLLYSFDVDEAVDSAILNDYKIVVHELKLDHRNNIQVNTRAGKTFFTSEVKNYSYWNSKLEQAVNGVGNVHMSRIKRMKVLKEFESKEKYTRMLASSIKSKCIIFANTQAQADRLADHSYHSKNPDSEENLKKFKDGTIDRLSCVLQLSEGVNVPDLKQGIIMHAYANERKASQRLGRMLRLNPDDKAVVHILCYVDTVDKMWVEEALKDYDPDKIEWRDFNIKIP
jgi:superfamily II DNA or RNA helicase